MARVLKLLILVGMCICLNACVVSRLGRPEISGTLLDYNNTPIENVKVGESITDDDGKFVLEERRYLDFIPIIALEAPPLMVSEGITKAGYEDESISLFSVFGGGGRRGAKWNVGNIYLKKVGDEYSIKTILVGRWLISASPEFDTLYLIGVDEFNSCVTSRCKELAQNYIKYTHDRWDEDNLPENVISRTINIQFSDIKFSLTEVQEVAKGRKALSVPSNHEGNWQARDNNTVEFTMSDHWLKGFYKVDTLSKTYLQLSRCDSDKGLEC